MKQELLPGIRLKDVSVFDLEEGTRVYDRSTARHGTISSIKETRPEVIEAFITMDNDTVEIPAYRLPFTVIIGGKK